MSKYDGLRAHLEALRTDRWEASFSEIEQVLGFKLPPSAREYHAWWGHEQHPTAPHKRAWLDAGWRTSRANLSRRTVRFERVKKTAAARAHDRIEPFRCSDPRVDRMARELANKTGEGVGEAVVIALQERLNRETAKRRVGLAEELMEIGRRVAALPDLTDETPEDMLYDEHGVPR